MVDSYVGKKAIASEPLYFGSNYSSSLAYPDEYNSYSTYLVTSSPWSLWTGNLAYK